MERDELAPGTLCFAATGNNFMVAALNAVLVALTRQVRKVHLSFYLFTWC